MAATPVWTEDDIPGAIFWCECSDVVGQEDQGTHPWIVISTPRLARKERLVLAVPMTSNPIQHYDSEVAVTASEITLRHGVKKPLKREKLDGWVKCAKVRHWSVDRIKEVVGLASRPFVHKIRVVVADAFDAPPYGTSSHKKRRG